MDSGKMGVQNRWRISVCEDSLEGDIEPGDSVWFHGMPGRLPNPEH
jgi:hypothetical protein